MAGGIGYLQEKIFGPQTDEDSSPPEVAAKAPPKKADKAKRYLPGGVGAIQTWLSGGDGEGAPVTAATPSAPEQPAIYTKMDWDGTPTGDWKDKTAPMDKTPVVKAKVKGAAAKGGAKPTATQEPKVDDLAEVRADLLANQRADEAARAAAERKRQEAEAFSKRLKSATARPAASKTGYDSYKSLMGE